MIQLLDQIKDIDSQLSQSFDEVLTNQQEPPLKYKLDDILAQELSDHQRKDLTIL